MPSQPPVELVLLARLLGPVAVLQLAGDVAIPLGEGADAALVQDLGLAQRRRHALALDAAIGGDGDGGGAQVGDRVGHGEHVAVIDRQHAGEAQALTVVPGQGDRRRRRQGRSGRQPPDGVGTRNATADVRPGPAELGEIGVLHALRPEQLLIGRGRVDGLAIVLQEQVVDPPALKRHRTLQRGGRDRDARDVAEGLGAVGDEGDRAGCACGRRDARRGRARRGGLLFLGLGGGSVLRGLPLLGLRAHHEDLVHNQDDRRHHGEDHHVARVLVLHAGQGS
ncbi:hypothetical protein MMB232_00671 [Brevundimonas subvibrioides]